MRNAVLWLSLCSMWGCRVESAALPPSTDLQRGGLYVAYNPGCENGCSDLARGDVIRSVDGRPVETRADLMSALLIARPPVVLEILRPGETSPHMVEIEAKPNEDYPPLEHLPPFWTVGAEALDRADEWARSPMFSHALPGFFLVHVDGDWINGRSLYGRKSIIVVWPDLPLHKRQYREFRDEMSVFYRVLQKAQSDLATAHVEIVFVVCGGSNDTTVHAELLEMGEVDDAGNPMPPLPLYRCPGDGGPWSPRVGPGLRAFDAPPSGRVGLENSARSFFDYVRRFPVVVVVDEGGIVRWHSGGYHEGPHDTILGAVMFAMHELDEGPTSVDAGPLADATTAG